MSDLEQSDKIKRLNSQMDYINERIREAEGHMILAIEKMNTVRQSLYTIKRTVNEPENASHDDK